MASELEKSPSGFLLYDRFRVLTKKGVRLGDFDYEEKWKCWVFRPLSRTQYSSGCLRDLAVRADHLERDYKGVD